MLPQWLKDEVADYDMDLEFTPATILDLGANMGAFSLRMHKRYPRAQIFAYEPMPFTCDAFNLECGHISNIHLTCAAVRKDAGRQNLFLGDMSVTNSFYQLGRQSKYLFPVDCVAASTLPAAEFIKIDTEGCEVEILQSLPLQNMKALVLEYHSLEDRKTLLDISHQNSWTVADIKEEENQICGILKFLNR